MARFIVATLVALLAGSGAAHASTAPKEMDVRVREAVVGALGGSVRPEDVVLGPAVRIGPCRAQLLAAVAGARNVEVRCPDAPGWKLYVPVRISHMGPVVVTTATVRPGSPLDATQLTVQQRDTAAIDGVGFSSVDQVAGKVAKRGLPPGAVVLTRDLAAEIAVRRGDSVLIESSIGGAVVQVEGKALGNAAVGGQLSVENVSTRRVVRGELVAEGRVQVGRR